MWFVPRDDLYTVVLLGQNCVRNIFNQKQCKYAMNIGVAQIKDALL